jgi:hypothetical protein
MTTTMTTMLMPKARYKYGFRIYFISIHPVPIRPESKLN